MFDATVKDFATSGGAQTEEVVFTYDVFNRLITRVYTPYSGGSPQTPIPSQFVYDGPSTGSWQSNNIVLAFNGNQALTDRYLWGPAVDQILADEQFSANATQMPTSAGSLFEVLGDNEWNVRDVIAASGAVQAHFDYDPFGRLAITWGAPIRFMHNGMFYDAATGLEYHGANGTGRWLNAGDQRWMSEDPWGLKPDTNPYRYVTNAPTEFADPTGLDRRIVSTTEWAFVHFYIEVDTWNSAGEKTGMCYLDFGKDDQVFKNGHQYGVSATPPTWTLRGRKRGQNYLLNR